MKYIDAGKLKKLVGELKERAKRNCYDSWGIVPDALEEVEGFISSLQQEQAEVDLEREIRDYFSKWDYDFYDGVITMDDGIAATLSSIQNVARHFYELGLKARKEDEK